MTGPRNSELVTVMWIQVLAIYSNSRFLFYTVSVGRESACDAGDLGSIPGLERSPGEGKATHPCILAWRIPWTKSMGSQRAGHDWATFPFTLPLLLAFFLVHGKREKAGQFHPVCRSFSCTAEVDGVPLCLCLLTFSSVQCSRSVASDSASPWTAARQASLSVTSSNTHLFLLSQAPSASAPYAL